MDIFDIGICKACGNLRALYYEPTMPEYKGRAVLCRDCNPFIKRKMKFEEHLKKFDAKYGKGANSCQQGR